jgi:hypothetical protein
MPMTVSYIVRASTVMRGIVPMRSAEAASRYAARR